MVDQYPIHAIAVSNHFILSMKELLNERGAAKRNCDGEPITQGVIYATRRVFEELERRPSSDKRRRDQAAPTWSDVEQHSEASTKGIGQLRESEIARAGD
jgi:hypothetical protein